MRVSRMIWRLAVGHWRRGEVRVVMISEVVFGSVTL